MTAAAQRLAEAGCVLLPAMLPAQAIDEIAPSLDAWLSDAAGSRNLLAHAPCAAMAVQLKAQLVALGLIEASAVAVQCTLFDKTAEKNWLVALHQDIAIPAANTGPDRSHAQFIKEGEPYVQPSAELLASLLALRVHLDDCGADAGPLRVVPGSHRHGLLDDAQAQALREAQGQVDCLAERGDALALRPLLLHASSRARAPVRRRVLHFLFGPERLPQGLVWNRAIGH